MATQWRKQLQAVATKHRQDAHNADVALIKAAIAPHAASWKAAAEAAAAAGEYGCFVDVTPCVSLFPWRTPTNTVGSPAPLNTLWELRAAIALVANDMGLWVSSVGEKCHNVTPLEYEAHLTWCNTDAQPCRTCGVRPREETD